METDPQLHANRLFRKLLTSNHRRAAWPLRAVNELLTHLGLPATTHRVRQDKNGRYIVLD